MARVGRLAGVDIDALFNALRPRIIALLTGAGGGGGGVAGPPGEAGAKGIVWRGEWAADSEYEIGDLVYLETAGGAVLTFLCLTAQVSLPGAEPTVGGDANWWELGPGYLIVDGVRPMIGDLDMGTPENAINNVKDLSFVGDVGHAVVSNPRVVAMAGDHTDDEAKIVNLERVVFNAEPTASSIENPSRLEMNAGVQAGVDYTAAEGKVSWDSVEEALIVYLASGVGVVLVALGWGVLVAMNGHNP